MTQAQNRPVSGIVKNLALGKPATQSSVNTWLQKATPELDAAMGNNGKHVGNYGFQTAFETDPWWQVDLQQVFSIGRVVVFNRIDAKEGCRFFSVLSSLDNENWQLRGVKLDDELFGGIDGNPYSFVFEPKFSARFVRVQLIGEGYLHLDEIEIYEDQVAYPTIDAMPPAIVADATFEARPDGLPLYQTAVVVCARWETDYIEEWLTYYKCIGYDHIYLYCNDDDPTALYEKALPFTAGTSPFATFTHFKGQGLQYAMYMHFIANYASQVTWVSFFDVDEFLNIVDGSLINDFLMRFDNDVDCILFNWVVFGTSGHKTNPPGKVLENYTQRADDINPYTKFIARASLLQDGKLQIPDLAFGFWHNLMDKLYRPVKVVNVLGSTERQEHYRGEEADHILHSAVLHHYLLRSEDAARQRIARGTGGEFGGQVIWDANRPSGTAGLTRFNEVLDISLANFWKDQAAKSHATGVHPQVRGALLSRGRPCTQSSLSEWSTGATLAEDASKAVNGQIDGKETFHTDKEVNPWWQIDLQARHRVNQIVIYNAAFHTRGRLRNFKIRTSQDAHDWSDIHSKQDDLPVGSLLTGPFELIFAPPIEFRYLRIVMIGEDFLHLDQVEIYGDASRDFTIA